MATTEFVVLPIFGSTEQPEYQIEIHLRRTEGLTLDELESALRRAQDLLAPGVALQDYPARLHDLDSVVERPARPSGSELGFGH